MKIAFLGDIAFLGQFDKSKSNDAAKRMEYLKDKLADCDYIVANLESPLTSSDRTVVCKSMHLKANPCNVDLLKYLNVSAVSLANNHIADYGKQGVAETIATLEQAKIQWFGIGDKCLDIEVKSEKISLSGFCCYSTNGTHYEGKNGIRLLTADNLERQLKKDKLDGRLSVISIHWGMEHTNYPAYEHICLMNRVLPEYSAIVAGHHPHVVQGISKIGNSLVAYSLGNAVFDTCISRNRKLVVELNENNRKGLMLSVMIENGRIIHYEPQGFYIGKKGIEPYNISEKIWTISHRLKNVENAEEYEEVRKKQYSETITGKFGKHDLKWVFNRLNYYAVGAKVSGILRNRKYQKEVEKFIHG